MYKEDAEAEKALGAGQKDGLAAAEGTDLELQPQPRSEMPNLRPTMKPSKRAAEAA